MLVVRRADTFFASIFPSSNAFAVAFQFRCHKICAYEMRTCVCWVCVGGVEAPNVEAALRAGALPSLTLRLVEIHAENGCHKCLSNFERQNVRE